MEGFLPLQILLNSNVPPVLQRSGMVPTLQESAGYEPYVSAVLVIKIGPTQSLSILKSKFVGETHLFLRLCPPNLPKGYLFIAPVISTDKEGLSVYGCQASGRLLASLDAGYVSEVTFSSPAWPYTELVTCPEIQQASPFARSCSHRLCSEQTVMCWRGASSGLPMDCND